MKIYRDALNSSVVKLTENKDILYLTKHFNINIANDAQNSSSNSFTNMLISNSSYPLIALPTRVTEQSQQSLTT